MTGRSRLSLAHKLSALTGAVIAFCLIVILGAAYAVLRRSAVTGMETRLATATRHLAGIVQEGVRQISPRYAALAHDSVLRRALDVSATTNGGRVAERARERSLITARELLTRFLLPTDSTVRIELYDVTPRPIIVVTPDARGGHPGVVERAASGIPRELRDAMDAAGNRDSLRLSRMYAVDGRAYFWFVQPVVAHGSTIGYIAQQRRIATNLQTDRSMRALAGEGVTIYYANDDGSAWTTLGGKLAPAHPVSSHPGAFSASARIGGTPLYMVMQSDIDYVLAPTRSTLGQLVLFGVMIIIAGMGAALLIGRRMVGPIVAIANAAEAVGRGDYDVRVTAGREIELARLAESFNQMANEVAAGDQARREIAHMGRVAAVAELASSIPHELRQPLTAILANGDSAALLLRRPNPDVDHAAKCVQHIVSDCNRAAGVINHIRVLIRKEERVTRTVDLNRTCRDAVHLLRQDAALRRTEVELSLTPDTVAVAGDPVELQQLVINLTLNALDAASGTRGRRRVTVSTAAVDGAAEVTVRDSGPGLPAALQQRLFEPFFTTKSNGLGMGLAIVRSIVERHHGRVHAENAADAGAVFTVTLPAQSEPIDAELENRRVLPRPSPAIRTRR